MAHCFDTLLHNQADLRPGGFNLENRREEWANQYCEPISGVTFPNLSNADFESVAREVLPSLPDNRPIKQRAAGKKRLCLFKCVEQNEITRVFHLLAQDD